MVDTGSAAEDSLAGDSHGFLSSGLQTTQFLDDGPVASADVSLSHHRHSEEHQHQVAEVPQGRFGLLVIEVRVVHFGLEPGTLLSSRDGDLVFVRESVVRHFISAVDGLFVRVRVDSQVVHVGVVEGSGLVGSVSSAVAPAVDRHSTPDSSESVDVVLLVLALDEGSFLLLVLVRLLPSFVSIGHPELSHDLVLGRRELHVRLGSLSEVVVSLGRQVAKHSISLGDLLEAFCPEVRLGREVGSHVGVVGLHEGSVGFLDLPLAAPLSYP